MYKKSKIFICLVICLYTLMLSSAFADQITINTQVLNIRENPNTSANIVGKAKNNEKYDVLDTSDNWVKITKDNKQGWVSKDYVILSKTTNNTVSKVVTAGKLNVRENPSSNSNIISGLSKGTLVKVLETKDGWDKIELSGKYGWVSNQYLSTSTQNNQTTNNTSTANETKEVVVNTNILNVRQSPNTNSQVLGKLIYNTKVVALSEENGWYKISYNGGYGYISASYTILNSQLISRGSYIREDLDLAAQLAEKAKTYLGYKYIYGGSSEKGFDCSGLVYFIYKNYVTNLPRGATSQSKIGQSVDRSELKKGDLIFFTENAGTNVTHVGIYLEDGNFVHATNPRRGVVIDSINSGYYNTNYLFAKRVI